jgi:hypothetical protein
MPNFSTHVLTMFREQVVRYCVDTTTAKTSSTNELSTKLSGANTSQSNVPLMIIIKIRIQLLISSFCIYSSQ